MPRCCNHTERLTSTETVGSVYMSADANCCNHTERLTSTETFGNLHPEHTGPGSCNHTERLTSTETIQSNARFPSSERLQSYREVDFN